MLKWIFIARLIVFIFLYEIIIFKLTYGTQVANLKTYIVRFKGGLDLPEKSSVSHVCKLLLDQFDKNYRLFKSVFKSKNVKKLWIINAIGIQATASEIRQIKNLEFVDSVKESKYRIFIPQEPESTRISDSELIIEKGSDPVWNLIKIGIPKVWQEFGLDGSGVVIGHLDTGVDTNHPALRNKVILFRDFTKATSDTCVTNNTEDMCYDDHGHGTHTAGTLVGEFGIGIAPQAKLIVAKVFDNKGGGEDIWLLEAMQWMLDPDQNPETEDCPKIISNSWGSDSTTDKTFWDAVRAWAVAGILPVFAAGNNGPIGKVGTPAGFPFSLAVGATTADDMLAYFSSVGPSLWDGITLIKPDVVAPGQTILSCSIGNGYVKKSGTSMACPHVAGLAALMLQANPALDAEKIRFLIEYTSLDLGKPGKDTKFGSGRINAYDAVKLSLDDFQPYSLFKEYERVLHLEQNLLKEKNYAQLSAPLANSIIMRFSKILNNSNFITENQNIKDSFQPCSKCEEAIEKLFNEIKISNKIRIIHGGLNDK